MTNTIRVNQEYSINGEGSTQAAPTGLTEKQAAYQAKLDTASATLNAMPLDIAPALQKEYAEIFTGAAHVLAKSQNPQRDAYVLNQYLFNYEKFARRAQLGQAHKDAFTLQFNGQAAMGPQYAWVKTLPALEQEIGPSARETLQKLGDEMRGDETVVETVARKTIFNKKRADETGSFLSGIRPLGLAGLAAGWFMGDALGVGGIWSILTKGGMAVGMSFLGTLIEDFARGNKEEIKPVVHIPGYNAPSKGRPLQGVGQAEQLQQSPEFGVQSSAKEKPAELRTPNSGLSTLPDALSQANIPKIKGMQGGQTIPDAEALSALPAATGTIVQEPQRKGSTEAASIT